MSEQGLTSAELSALRGLLAKMTVSGVNPVPAAFAATGGIQLTRESEGVAKSDTSSRSWADQVELEQASVIGVPPASDTVRNAVVFGGFSDLESGDSKFDISSGGMAKYVRTSSAKQLRNVLKGMGVWLPKKAKWHLAMVTHTSATMPEFFHHGKDKLRTLAVLGDAMLVAAVAYEAMVTGDDLSSVQSVRTTMLTDSELARRFAASDFCDCVSFGAGVTASHSKTGATALEAIFGLIGMYCSPAQVSVVARELGLLKFNRQ